MRLENSFQVPGSAEAAWKLLLDVERIIPCMPGAELSEVVDDSHWKTKMHVKLGPIALAFATDLAREEVDEAARRVKLSARARELRGRGGAQATIESSLGSDDGVTTATIVTDLTMSGAVAQYGRGIVQDVASQLVKRFADCLADQLQPVPAPEGEREQRSETAAELRAAVPAPVHAPRPVGGLRLLLGALGRSLIRIWGARRRRGSA